MKRIQIKNVIPLLVLLGVQAGSSRVLAEEPGVDEMRERLQACAACHAQTDQTLSREESYNPSIDGKPVEYLYQQLLNFRDGRRHNPLMRQMLAYLSPEYLHDIASYYAQKPSIPLPEPSTEKEDMVADVERARKLVEYSDGDRPACTDCHGEDLAGDGVAIPGLRGLGAVYITAQLGAWQAGTRRAREPDCMADVANALDGADMAAVAQWIANAPPAPEQAVSAAARDLPVPCGAVQ